jgi:hypothetical protein
VSPREQMLSASTHLVITPLWWFHCMSTWPSTASSSHDYVPIFNLLQKPRPIKTPNWSTTLFITQWTHSARTDICVANGQKVAKVGKNFSN